MDITYVDYVQGMDNELINQGDDEYPAEWCIGENGQPTCTARTKHVDA